MRRGSHALLVVTALALTALLAGCDRPGDTRGSQGSGTAGKVATNGPGAAASGGSEATRTSTTGSGQGAAVPGATSIPPGRSFAEGGGGPTSYTFRDEWRRAAAIAQQWRPGAFLVTASGADVNSDGVPSSWTMTFVSSIPADEILALRIDPWGKITSRRVVDTTKVRDLLQPGDARIPFGVADSDSAVESVSSALEAAGVSATGNATLSLAFARDHTGPYWTYSAEGSGYSLMVVRVDAMTGEAKITGR